MKQVTQIILGSLILNEPYARKVLPYLKEEYFDGNEKVVFSAISEHITKYNTLPTKESLVISIDETKGLNENTFKEVVSVIDDSIDNLKVPDDQWLYDVTEKHAKDKAIFNAIMTSIKILDQEKAGGKVARGEIPNVLSEALSVNFDEQIGHDYIENSNDRYDFYHRTEKRLPFDLEVFNKITKNGFTPKTLNIFLSPTHAGKTLFKCHFASSYLVQGYNVLYITLEMSEEKIAERIDANLFDMEISKLENLSKEDYKRKIDSLRNKVKGKLFIKEYPTAAGNVNHFRHLLQELKLKKKFTPDVIMIDYLNICASSRLKQGNTVNSYSYVKSIVEELRGLAVEYGVAIITSSQTNREGYANSDIELTSTSESMGTAMTADFMAAIIRTEELDKSNQIMIKQLKNRYEDLSKMPKFVIGVDRSKMKLFDLSPSAQANINTVTEEEQRPQSRFGDRSKKPFTGIRV